MPFISNPDLFLRLIFYYELNFCSAKNWSLCIIEKILRSLCNHLSTLSPWQTLESAGILWGGPGRTPVRGSLHQVNDLYRGAGTAQVQRQMSTGIWSCLSWWLWMHVTSRFRVLTPSSLLWWTIPWNCIPE